MALRKSPTSVRFRWYIFQADMVCRPELAAAYAYEDACVDHADEGIYAAVYLAALEAAAFTEHRQNRLLDIAAAQLPIDSTVRRCVTDARLWWKQSRDWRRVREQILRAYGHENFTDVTMNLGFTVLGWLAAEGDFGKGICVATNCGKDTDCTAATVGALMGIIDPAGIDQRWIAPIGQTLVVDARITGIQPPPTLDLFTDMVLDIADRLRGKPPLQTAAPASPVDRSIPATIGFVATLIPFRPGAKAPVLPQDARPVQLRGTVMKWPRADFKQETMVIRYLMRLPEPQRVRIVFNSPQKNAVWIDGTYAFGREGGRMCPALHRSPANQWIDLDLTAGSHEIIAALQRPTADAAKWVIAIGDARTHQWLLDIWTSP